MNKSIPCGRVAKEIQQFHGGAGMKLEDCTKEELIYLLNRRCWRYISSTSELELDVLMYRSEQTNKAMGHEAGKEAEALAEYTEALAEYTELLKPYVGERLVDIPENIINKASNAMERYKKHQDAYASLQRKHDKIQRQIDKNINKKGE